MPAALAELQVSCRCVAGEEQVRSRCGAMEQLPFIYGLAGFNLYGGLKRRGAEAQLASAY
jgi:hypothetical protein